MVTHAEKQLDALEQTVAKLKQQIKDAQDAQDTPATSNTKDQKPKNN